MSFPNIVSPLGPVWTAGSTSTVSTHPRSRAMPSNQVHDGRVALELRRSSGNLKLRAGLQYSNDGETWDTAEAFGPAYTSTEGHTYETTFTDLTALGTRKVFVRFVLLTLNTTGSDVELADAALRVDLEGSE